MILQLTRERRGPVGDVHAAGLRDPLTERELDVLELLEARLATREIAACLVISVPAVEWHAANAYRKLHLSNRRAPVNLLRPRRASLTEASTVPRAAAISRGDRGKACGNTPVEVERVW